MRLIALVSTLLLVGLAVPAEAAPFLLATRPGSGDVVALDLATGNVAATFPAGSLPGGAVLSADGARLFVADGAAGQLRIIDLTTGSVQTVAVGNGAAGVALCPGGTRLGVALAGDDALAIVDVGTLTLIGTAPTGDQPLAVSCGDGYFAVTNYGAATLTIVDATTLAVAGTAPVGSFPAGVVIAGLRAWVTSLFDANVTVVSLATATVSATVPVGSASRGISTAAGRVFVGNVNADTLSVLDVATAGVVGTVPLPTSGPTDVLAAGAMGPIYVGHLGEPAVTVVDAVTLAIADTVNAPTGLMILAGVVSALAATASIPVLSPAALACLAVLLALVAIRTRGGLALILAFALGIVPAGALNADPVTYTESTFFPTDWEIFFADVGSGSQQATQSNTRGTPPPSRDMIHFNAPGETVRVQHRWLGATHDPAVDGIVETIDVTWNRIASAGECPPGDTMEAFVVYQNGVAYVGPEVTFADLMWSSTAFAALDAADFQDGGGNPPDFSASAAAITFGFQRRTSSAPGRTACHGMDEFSVTVQTPTEGGESFVAFTDLQYFTLVGESAVVRATRTGNLTNELTVDVLLGGGKAVRSFTWPAGTGGVATVTFTAAEIDGEGDDLAVQGLLLFNAPEGTSFVAGRERALLYRGTTPLAGLWTVIVVALAKWDATGTALLAAAALYALVRRRSRKKPAAAPAIAP